MTHVLLPFMVLPIYSVLLSHPEEPDAGGGLARAPGRCGPSGACCCRSACPGVLSGSLLVFMVAIGYYITPALVGGANDQMISSVIAFYATGTANWGMAGALGLILLRGDDRALPRLRATLDVTATAGGAEAVLRVRSGFLRHRSS